MTETLPSPDGEHAPVEAIQAAILAGEDANDTDSPNGLQSLLKASDARPERILHTVRLAKQAGRALDDDKSDSQITTIIAAVPTASLKRGWTIEYANPNPERFYDRNMDRERSDRYAVTGDRSNGWTYTVDLLVSCQPKALRSTLAMEFDNIVSAMDTKAQQPANRWRVSHVDEQPWVARDIARIEVNEGDEIGYAPFEMPSSEVWNSAFDHLYGLDDYIEIIRSTLELGQMSGWRDRVNIALIGPPACGKSDICKSLKRALGDDAVLEFDGTSTTMAGAQEELQEREELPRVLLIEEIEKAEPRSLSWLLSVLDLRGEVRKTTARGKILKEVHMVGICTVNNVDLFDTIASGALASRFSMPLEFVRPTRDILWKILHREVSKIGGDLDWIEPALDFAEEIDTSDPRKIIAVCLTGREKLLDGSYQKMLRRTMPRTMKERKADNA